MNNGRVFQNTTYKNRNDEKENLVSVPFMVLGIVFCVCLIAANLLETKVVQLGPISVTAGLIVFPISYIINDCIAEVWGFRKARLIIWMGFLMNFMVVAMGQLAVALPAAPFGRAKKDLTLSSVWPHALQLPA